MRFPLAQSQSDCCFPSVRPRPAARSWLCTGDHKHCTSCNDYSCCFIVRSMCRHSCYGSVGESSAYFEGFGSRGQLCFFEFPGS